MLSDLFQRWLRQIGGLLPPFVRPGANDGRAVPVTAMGKSAEGLGGSATRLPRTGAAVLRRSAEHVLRQVPTHGTDRLAPFTAAGIVRELWPGARDRAHGRTTQRRPSLRRRIANAGADRTGLVAQRRRGGNVRGTRAALSDGLPDDTCLTELSLNRRTLLVRGQSPAAPRHVALQAGVAP